MNICVTGGAGFVGSNVALHFARQGHHVTVYDNCSRTEKNLTYLFAEKNIRVEVADVRNLGALMKATFMSDLIVHAAAQAAVTHSLTNPRHDFEVNALGTFNVLEAARARGTPVAYLSTNKVYGDLEDVPLWGRESRYEPEHADTCYHIFGIGEARSVDPTTPYGVSKYVGDAYTQDYARIYDLPTVTFRMSCIYGGLQHGDTHQGWVAHMMLASLRDEDITVYGDGRQVRDLLHVEDVIHAIERAPRNGQVFNLGGGPANSISILELLKWIHAKGVTPRVAFNEARPGDQRWYTSDTSRLKEASGWDVSVPLSEGLARLWAWCKEVA